MTQATCLLLLFATTILAMGCFTAVICITIDRARDSILEALRKHADQDEEEE